jgi:23S rRNA (adenine-N6)-dimethyltransferase
VTAALVAVGARVVAVERDPNLARKLRVRFASDDVRVVEGDLAEVAFEPPFKAVANPPFNQTATLLRRLLFEEPGLQAATLVLQREAAERYAGVRTSALSLMAQPWFELAAAFPFSRRDFTPVPNVDVAVLHIARRATPWLDAAAAPAWQAFVRAAFARAKPDARRTFRPVLSNLQWRRLTADLGISPGAPCTELSLAQWLGLYRFVATCTPAWKRASFAAPHP